MITTEEQFDKEEGIEERFNNMLKRWSKRKVRKDYFKNMDKDWLVGAVCVILIILIMGTVFGIIYFKGH